MTDPNIDAERDTLAVWAGGEMIGYGMVRGSSGVLDGRYRVHVEGVVAPPHRRQGIGGQVMDWLLERAAAVRAERHPDVAGTADVSASTTSSAQRALLARRGFQPQRWFFTMTRGLSDPPDVRVPSGLRLVRYDPVFSEPIRLAHNEAFADHWGSTPRGSQEWTHWAVGQRAFRPAVSFLLTDGSQEVAAYLLSYEYEAETAATGVRDAYVGSLGTRRQWRGRGAARALLARAVGAYAEAGYQRTSLDVDADNPNGALALYRAVGYAVHRTSVSYALPLLPTARTPRRGTSVG